MPRSSIKDEEQYRALRRDGMSKEKAARISNASARDGRDEVARRGGQAPDLDDLSRDELYTRARELEVHGRSRMTKAELRDAIRRG